jgi:hypothetical protein
MKVRTDRRVTTSDRTRRHTAALVLLGIRFTGRSVLDSLRLTAARTVLRTSHN